MSPACRVTSHGSPKSPIRMLATPCDAPVAGNGGGITCRTTRARATGPSPRARAATSRRKSDMVRFLQITGHGKAQRKRVLVAVHEPKVRGARRPHADLEERILTALLGANAPLSSGQILRAVSQGKPLAVPRP